MNLGKKKALAARTLGVGKSRVVFLQSRVNEIKDAITKQDIRDLKNDGAILVKDVKGRKKVVKTRNRSPGNVRLKVNTRKKDYVIMVRKQRSFVKHLKGEGKLTQDEFKNLRKKIKNKMFRSKAALKEYVGGMKK